MCVWHLFHNKITDFYIACRTAGSEIDIDAATTEFHRRFHISVDESENNRNEVIK